MNKNRMALLSCFLFLSVISVFSRADVDCKGGGDNGTPFVDISKEFNEKTELLHTPNLIKDFIVREDRKELVYRTEDNRIWKATAAQQLFGYQYMQSPLSRILDPWQSFAVSKNMPQALNTTNNAWYRVGNKQRRGQDLYWDDSRLFSLEQPDYASQTIRYAVHYLNGSTQNFGCKLNFGESVEMHIGNSGHTFPYLFIYTTKEMPDGGTKVAKYALRLEAKKKLIGVIPRCELTSIGVYKDLMPGKVKALYHFGNLENTDNSAWLMDIANPKKRMLWSYKDQCIYFKAPVGKILVPNPQIPIVALQKSEGGLKLLYPWLEKSADILGKFVTQPISSENLWLTRDRKTLYVAAQPEHENARVLLKVALDKVQ